MSSIVDFLIYDVRVKIIHFSNQITFPEKQIVRFLTKKQFSFALIQEKYFLTLIINRSQCQIKFFEFNFGCGREILMQLINTEFN